MREWVGGRLHGWSTAARSNELLAACIEFAARRSPITSVFEAHGFSSTRIVRPGRGSTTRMLRSCPTLLRRPYTESEICVPTCMNSLFLIAARRADPMFGSIAVASQKTVESF
jgi:hypothetical protein